jgi:hypothetical protein
VKQQQIGKKREKCRESIAYLQDSRESRRRTNTRKEEDELFIVNPLSEEETFCFLLPKL